MIVVCMGTRAVMVVVCTRPATNDYFFYRSIILAINLNYYISSKKRIQLFKMPFDCRLKEKGARRKEKCIII